MSDVVVTVPKRLWVDWLAEGDLPGEPWSGNESHFWFSQYNNAPRIEPGERVYIVAHGLVRGYAPLVRVERRCMLRPERSCLVRHGGAVAVTVMETRYIVTPLAVPGFQGWRYRWWDCNEEMPFPAWRLSIPPQGGML